MNELSVKANKAPIYFLGVLAIFLLPASIYLFAASVGDRFRIVPFGLGIGLIAILAVSGGLFMRGHRRSIKQFTAGGVALNNGREVEWSRLSRVVDKMSIKPGTEKRRLWRTELQFGDGTSAWIIPSKVSNYDEVRTFVAALKCEHLQEDA